MTGNHLTELYLQDSFQGYDVPRIPDSALHTTQAPVWLMLTGKERREGGTLILDRYQSLFLRSLSGIRFDQGLPDGPVDGGFRPLYYMRTDARKAA